MFMIEAKTRHEQGKGASRRLRVTNQFPAIVYGGEKPPVSIQLDQNKLMNMQAKEGFYTEVLTLLIDGKEEKVKVQAVQRHAFKPKFLHLDFLRVSCAD